MSVTVTIEHDGGAFRRQYRISRHADAVDMGQSEFNARHLYLIEQTGGGGAKGPIRVFFEHRYGDPLHTLLAEGLAALALSPRADRALFDTPFPRAES